VYEDTFENETETDIIALRKRVESLEEEIMKFKCHILTLRRHAEMG
jgi:hypothetical protein